MGAHTTNEPPPIPDSKLAQFGGHKYIALETFKKNGQGVKTPIWFVVHNDALYAYTEADSWKIKRIRNNPRVRVAVCNIRGAVKGPWVEATGSIVDGDERLAANTLLDRKYFLKKIFNVLTRMNRHRRAMIKILLLAFVLGATPVAAQSVPYQPANPIQRGMTDKDFPKVVKLGDNVFAVQVLPPQAANAQPNAVRYTTNTMFVVTSDGVLVADAQGSIAAANLVLDEIRKVTSQPIRYFVICSEHADHTGGISAFPETATYISSPFTQNTFATQVNAPNRAANAPKVYVPSVTVDDSKVLTLGGTEIQILKLGRSHTGGDIVVYLPREKVLWLSETFNSNRFPTLRTGYPSEWIPAIDKAQRMDVNYYAGAHGLIDDAKTNSANLAEYRAALETLVAEVKRLHQPGADPDAAFKQANFGRFAMWTDFEAQAPVAFKRAWDELEGKLK